MGEDTPQDSECLRKRIEELIAKADAIATEAALLRQYSEELRNESRKLREQLRSERGGNPG